MRKPGRAFTLASAITGAACLAFGTMMVVSYHLNMTKDGIRVTSGFHVGFFDGGIWFFRHEWPYSGSMVRMGVAGHGYAYKGGYARPSDPTWSWHAGHYGFGRRVYLGERNEEVGRDTGCDFPGVYYRHFTWLGEQSDWTLKLSIWYPIILLAILPFIWAFRLGRSRHNPAAPGNGQAPSQVHSAPPRPAVPEPHR